MENKLKQLKEIIQKANPEIMELKFGCEVDFMGTKRIIINKPDNDLMDSIDLFTPDDEEIETITIGVLKVKGIKILGRPIQLADVFLACPNGPDFYDKQVIPIVDLWNFKKKFDSQSEKFINLSWEIICSK